MFLFQRKRTDSKNIKTVNLGNVKNVARLSKRGR